MANSSVPETKLKQTAGFDPSLLVKQFTEESTGQACPTTPKVMGKDAAIFLIKMVMSELVELAQTVTDDTETAVALVRDCAGVDAHLSYKLPTASIEVVAEQADALVDAMYYMHNAGCKHGWNLTQVFNVVHQANMAKKWDDNTFHRRDDGKVIKPQNWVEPDIVAEMTRQEKQGSW